MYTPLVVPGVPCQAVMPPPHARFARVPDWNQLQKLAIATLGPTTQNLQDSTPKDVYRKLITKRLETEW